MRRRRRAVLPAAAAALALACSARLPDYARPVAYEAARPPEDADLVPYRTLARADFQAPGPPAHLARAADPLCAATCAHLLLEDVPVTIRSLGAGGPPFEARADRIRFRARMDRRCSWWRRGGCPLPEAYVLEHEQIHFAIVEREARRLNLRAAELAGEVRARGDSPEEASRRARERLEAVLRDASQQVLEGHTRLDEDTSIGHEPEKQKAWYERTMRELEAMRAGASDGAQP